MNRHLPKNSFGDFVYSSALFYKIHGRLPNQGLGYNDQLFKIKTGADFNHPLRAFVSDKELVKVFVDGVLGPGYRVPTLQVLGSLAEVRAYSFPARCCIKPTHMSGEVILRKQNEPIDSEKIASWFGVSFYYSGRETNYKNLSPKVIVEPLIFDGVNITDYKIFCFRGRPKLVQVDVDRFTGHRRTFYDPDWVKQSFRYGEPEPGESVPRPANLDRMLHAATSLSRYFDFIRVDLYSDGESVLVGELTNCPCNCTSRFRPTEAELVMGRMIFGEAAAIDRPSSVSST